MSDFIVQVPATTANLGPGFDSFGLSLKCYNRFHLSCSETQASSLFIAPGTCVDTAGLALEPERNLFFKAFNVYYARIGKTAPSVRVGLEIHIPPARGLGSSSTAIIGGLVAANTLEDNELTPAALLDIALELEGHPDNVAPALYGGVLLCDEKSVYPMVWPDSWKILLLVPSYPLLTEAVRKVLPMAYPIGDAIYNLRKASLLVYAILRSDEAAFRQSLFDRLHHPYRIPLISGFEELYERAMSAGAFGVVISGAGPSIAVFYSERLEDSVYQSLKAYQLQKDPEMKLWRLAVDMEGAKVSEGKGLR